MWIVNQKIENKLKLFLKKNENKQKEAEVGQLQK